MKKISKDIEKIEKNIEKYMWLTMVNQDDETIVKRINLVNDYLENYMNDRRPLEFLYIARFFRVLLKECPMLYYYLYSRGYLNEVQKLLNYAFYEGIKYQMMKGSVADERNQ